MGATSQLSTRATGPALKCRTRQQAEVLVHVTGSLANLAGKYSPGSSLVETKAARAHTPGPDNPIPLPLGIICFSLLLRDLTTLQQQVERLEQRLVQEEERREENNRRSRKRVWWS